MHAPPRLRLAHLPTPLEPAPRLSEQLGVELWIKRDDATGGPEAGNKIRKLEFLLADAIEQGADTVLTCGGEQSNHARATAIAAARLGLRCTVFLRVRELEDDDGGRGIPLDDRVPWTGNVLIDHLVGADVRLISQATWTTIDACMQRELASLAERGRKGYAIPAGGSNAVGAWGYLTAMEEVAAQLEELPFDQFDAVVHACGSGGTTAGIALGLARHRVAQRVHAMAVADSIEWYREVIASVVADARSRWPDLAAPAPWSIDARAMGPAYAVSTPAQRDVMRAAARQAGLVLDPVYSGKAMWGLQLAAQAGDLRGRVLFVHTGGLPGLLAQGDVFRKDARGDVDRAARRA